MNKANHELGDLSFTEEELLQLRKAEQEEADRTSATSPVLPCSSPEEVLSWWDNWVRRITVR